MDLEKLNLVLTHYIFNYHFFSPFVFSHDNFTFDKMVFEKVLIAFFRLLIFIDSCGIGIQTSYYEISPEVKHLYKMVNMNENARMYFFNYCIDNIDYINFDINKCIYPDGTNEKDYKLVKLYLCLKTGAALNKKAIEHCIGETLTDAKMITLKKVFEDEINCKLNKRKDNSYELEVLDDEC